MYLSRWRSLGLFFNGDWGFVFCFSKGKERKMEIVNADFKLCLIQYSVDCLSKSSNFSSMLVRFRCSQYSENVKYPNG